MAAPQTFRSQLSGFNREDVIHYIEYVNSKHSTETNQLKNEIQNLNCELDSLRGSANTEELEQAHTTISELEQKCADLAQQLEEAQNKATQQQTVSNGQELEEANAAIANLEKSCAQLTCQLEEANGKTVSLEQKCADLTRQLEQTRQENTEQENYNRNQELETYRRAERAERHARERAAQIYHQANGTLADASVQVDATAQQIGAMADQVMAQLSQLQSAVAGSKQALLDASDILASIHPEIEE